MGQFSGQKLVPTKSIELPPRRKALRLRFFLCNVDRSVLRSYSRWFFFCECLNLVNVVFQWWVTDWFLNGGFFSYGAAVVQYYSNSMMHGGNRQDLFSPFDVVFPKVNNIIVIIIIIILM